MGQNVIVTASAATGGTGAGTYTYAWTVNSGTSCPGLTAPGNVLTFTYTPSTTTSSCEFNVAVTDSATTPDSKTSTTPLIKVNPALVAPRISSPASATTLDVGQSVSLSAYAASGGTPDTYSDYAYSWTNSGSCPGFTPGPGIPSLTYTPTGTTTDCAFILTATDSATTPESNTSAASPTITVNSGLSQVSTPTAVSAVDAGQVAATDTLPTPIGGTGPVTYSWSYRGPGSSNAYTQASSSQCAKPSGTATNGLGISCVTPSGIPPGSYTFLVMMKDSASNPVYMTSSVSGTSTVSAALAGVSLTLNPTVEGSQQESIVYTWSGGTPNYSGNIIVYNSVATIANMPFTGATGTSNTLTFKVHAGDTGIYTVSAHVQDSATAIESNTLSNTLMAYNALTAPASPTLSANTLDANQALTVNGTIPSTGAPPYSYQWFYSTGGSYASANSICTTGSGTGVQTGNIVSCFAAANTLTVGDTYTFELEATDNASTPDSKTSAASPKLTVNSVLSTANAPTAVSKVDGGQTAANDTLPATIGGTASVAYSWYYNLNGSAYNPVTTQCATPSNTASSGLGISCVTPSGITSGSYTFEVEMKDSASTPVITTSTASPTITIKSAPSITGFASSSGPFYPGRAVNFSAAISGGTGPFTANLVLNGNVIASVSNVPTNTLFSFNGISLSLGNYSYDIIAMDAGPTQQVKFNSTPITITVVNGPSGGGGSVSKVTLTDNISVPINSKNPVFYAFVSTPSTGTVTRQEIYQAQLPYSVTFGSAQVLDFSFACSFAAGTTTYNYADDVHGLGTNAVCGRNYTESSGTFEALYSGAAATSTATTTIAATTVNATAIILQKITNQSGSVMLNISSSSPAKVDYTDGRAEFDITYSSTQGIGVLLKVANATAASPAAPANYTKIIAINESINSTTASVESTLTYNCNGSIASNRIAPYILRNGTWVAITPFTVNSGTCAVTFAIPNDPTIALMEGPSTNATKVTSTVTTSILPLTTTIASTSKKTTGLNYIPIEAVAAILIIAIMGFAYFRFIRKPRHPKH